MSPKEKPIEGLEPLEKEIDEKIAQCMADGLTQAETGAKVGRDRATVNARLKNELVQARIKSLRLNKEEKVQQLLEAAYPNAWRTVISIMLGKETVIITDEEGEEKEISSDVKRDSTRLKAAFRILDRMEPKKLPGTKEKSSRRSPQVQQTRDEEAMQEALDRVS